MRHLTLGLGLCGLAAIGLVLSGWTPVASKAVASGPVVLCSKDAPQEHWIDLSEDPQPAARAHAPSDCPFASRPVWTPYPAPELPLPLMGPEQALWYRAPAAHHSAGFPERHAPFGDSHSAPALS